MAFEYINKKSKEIKKQFSHLLVLFFQFQIKLTNRMSVLRKTDKQKSSISDKLTAETLRNTSEDIEPSEEVNKMDETLERLEGTIARLNAVSEEFLNKPSENGCRTTKGSTSNLNDETADMTNNFDTITFLNTTMDRSTNLQYIFIAIGAAVVLGFTAIFYLGHVHSKK